MLALGSAPLLPSPENLLFRALTKFEPAAPKTAVLLAYKETLLRAMVAPATDAFAPTLLLSSTVVSTFRTAPPAEATAPPLAPNITELLTVPIPGAATSMPSPLTREVVT